MNNYYDNILIKYVEEWLWLLKNRFLEEPILLFMEVSMKKKNYLKQQEGINLHEDLILLWKDADGKVHWGNVGKTNAVGKPIKREILAMQDLDKIRHANGVSDRVHFCSYNCPETNKKTKKSKSSYHLWK